MGEGTTSNSRLPGWTNGYISKDIPSTGMLTICQISLRESRRESRQESRLKDLPEG